MILKNRYIVVALAILAMPFSEVVARPRFAVNIVVSGMRQSDIARYEKGFGKDGILRLRNEGVEFSECYIDYAPTTPEAGLATFATGALPSMHGVRSSVLFDRAANRAVELCNKNLPEQEGLVRKEVEECYTTQPFVAQTLAEAVNASSDYNRSITIAHSPLSAMILAGRKGECYWLSDAGRWTSADCYTNTLPLWVRTYNSEDMNRVFATDTWYGRYTRNNYRNSRTTDIVIYERGNAKTPRTRRKLSEGWVDKLCSMPSGNLAILEFAKQAVKSLLPLHIEEGCKVLNICLDTPRIVAERYGTDSIEYEDMLYSLDVALADFLTFVYAQLPSHRDILVTLTSDSGISPTKVNNDDSARFNPRQFEVLMNAFLSARYGQDNWILGYSDGSLYLNHDVVYRHKKSLVEVQNEVANFALQYRGVAMAVTATALRSAQFSYGVVSLMQRGYYPRHSGDVLLMLDAERIEYDSERVAMSGSAYSYDRHIPLLISGMGVAPRKVLRRVTNEQIAPTLAMLLGVERPQCSEAEILMVE